MFLDRILFTLIVLLGSPFLWTYFFCWLLIPENYDYDGATNFGIAFSIAFFSPLMGIISAIIAWFWSAKWKKD
ncbi:MAG: PspC domain-containing protein [Bacteroidia bacterium]|nr:PspC domain-containing protein [Bacteroidia bacterium]